MSVNSPYNFIPATPEAEVYIPKWRKHISHDIPFSDGESGEIAITITAQTPIFIRDGHQLDQETEEFSHFIKNNRLQYFIPATSLKGMIRNVMEILSKSQMKMINDHRYSFRDLSKGSLYRDEYDSSKVRCGWLVQDEDEKWIIEDCGEPSYITHEEIDELCHAQLGVETQFKDTFDAAIDRRFQKHYKCGINKYRYLKRKTKKLFNKLNLNGSAGTLIFTGQPGQRNHQTEQGKNGEFLFSGQVIKTIEVTETKQKEFRFIYLDHDERAISEEWKYWRPLLNKGQKIPVFFSTTEADHLLHFGLAFMYKLPFKHSVQELLPYRDYRFENMDMTEAIFGQVDGPQGALKGRVFFSHALAEADTIVRSDKQVREILASPKASFYPFYLQQSNPVQRYSTYLNGDAKLRGFKRYPIRDKVDTSDYTPQQRANGKVFCKFRPLGKGAVFQGKIRFHNLRPPEIGALLSALTFHGSNKSMHALGAAKPFGYGVVKVEAILNEKGLKKSKDKYLAMFEELMGGEDWLQSPALTELAAMTQVTHESLEYPDSPQAFVTYKNQKPQLALLSYSQIVGKHSFKHFPSIKKKVDTIDQGLKLSGQTLQALKKEMSGMGFGPVQEALHQGLKDHLILICKDHRLSKGKLNKKPFEQSFEWYKTISEWMGHTAARTFYDEFIQIYPPK